MIDVLKKKKMWKTKNKTKQKKKHWQHMWRIVFSYLLSWYLLYQYHSFLVIIVSQMFPLPFAQLTSFNPTCLPYTTDYYYEPGSVI